MVIYLQFNYIKSPSHIIIFITIIIILVVIMIIMIININLSKSTLACDRSTTTPCGLTLVVTCFSFTSP